MNSRPSVAWIVATCIVLACAACGGQDKTARAEYTEPRLKNVGIVDAGVVLPFGEYTLARPDLERMAREYAQLLGRCLDSRNAAVPTGAYFAGDYLRPPTPQANASLVWGGPFGTLDAAHAKRWGYHASPDGLYANGPAFYQSSPDNVTLGGQSSPGLERAERELDGPLDAGKTTCRADVEEQLAAPMPDLSDLTRDTSQLALSHPDVVPKLAAWVTCMSDAGFGGFKNVYDAEMSVYLIPLSDAEITLAVKDVECTTSSRWADFYYAALADYQKQAIKNNPDTFSSALSQVQKRADAISAAVDQGAG